MATNKSEITKREKENVYKARKEGCSDCVFEETKNYKEQSAKIKKLEEEINSIKDEIKGKEDSKKCAESVYNSFTQWVSLESTKVLFKNCAQTEINQVKGYYSGGNNSAKNYPTDYATKYPNYYYPMDKLNIEKIMEKYIREHFSSDLSRECQESAYRLIKGKLSLTISQYRERIISSCQDKHGRIEYPFKMGGGTGFFTTRKDEILGQIIIAIDARKQDLDKKEEELANAKALMDKYKSEFKAACEFLLQQSSKIQNQDSYQIASFASGKNYSKLFDLRNINDKNFRGNSILKDAGLENNSMITDSTLNVMTNGNRVLNNSRSYIYNKDFLINDTLSLYKDLEIDHGYRVAGISSGLITKPLVQSLILNEFQPYDVISPADVLPGAVGSIVGVLQTTGDLLGGNVIVALGKHAMNKSKVDDISLNPSQLYGLGAKTRERKYFTSDPVQVVQNMFNGGKWLNTYELPYYGKDYLKGKHSDKWSLGDSSGFLGALAGNDDPGSIGAKGFGIDFPSNPKFNPEMSTTRDAIKVEFYLVNTNTQWLKRNFEFIQAFYAGTNWMHLTFCVVRPPNVYHVLCPGRFQIYWAAIDLKVTFEGKLRKNVEASKYFMSKGINSINEDMLWPEAWKMEINIKPLTPANFNMYSEYYEHGFNAEEVAKLENEIKLVDAINHLSKHIKELAGSMKNAIVSGIFDVKKSLVFEDPEKATIEDVAKKLAEKFGMKSEEERKKEEEERRKKEEERK
jgi:hypothetical protein